jgi:hypothetical protein
MHVRKLCSLAIAFAAVVLAAHVACALGFQLGETKERLGLKYDLTVQDHGTGRVTVDLAIADEGRLKPLNSVDLVVPSQDGTGFVDLSLSLATRQVDGKLWTTVQLKKDLAERAEIQLKTSSLDGKKKAATWYYHTIPIAKYIKKIASAAQFAPAAPDDAQFDTAAVSVQTVGPPFQVSPVPPRVDLSYHVEGGDDEGRIFYQLLGVDRTQGFVFNSDREIPIKNGRRLKLLGMDPGKYRICRRKKVSIDHVAFAICLDEQFVELRAGETTHIRFVRDKGARIRGKVTWPPGAKLAGVLVWVRSGWAGGDCLDCRRIGADGRFVTERVPAGRYVLEVEAYRTLPRERLLESSPVGPDFILDATVDVPESGEVQVPDSALSMGKAGFK